MSEIVVDVVVRPKATTVVGTDLRNLVSAFFKGLGRPISPGETFIPTQPAVLVTLVEKIRVCDLLPEPVVFGPSVNVKCYLHGLHAFEVFDEPLDGEAEDGAQLPACEITAMPNRGTDGLWETLCYGGDVKQRLLRYAEACMVLSRRGVDPNLVSWNRIVLLHGPPGTGKTSLCKALCHKLSIRMRAEFEATDLVEVNAHSLFSRWFSESGKQVMQLFRRIREMAENPKCLVCVLIDEVESLAAARRSAASGNEPSDAIRVVNALLTQLDALRRLPNVLVLATSNITGTIDLAFVDRADMKILIPPPPTAVKVAILASAVENLINCGVVAHPHAAAPPVPRGGDEGEGEMVASPRDLAAVAQALLPVVEELDAYLQQQGSTVSGRTLRKLPMLAFTHSALLTTDEVPFPVFVTALRHAAMADAVARSELPS